MLLILKNYYKYILFFLLFILISLSSFYIGYSFEKSKFDSYKEDVLKQHQKEINDFIDEQKKQSIKDKVLVDDLNNKIEILDSINKQRKDDLYKLLKNNSNIKDCKLDNDSLLKLNESITNQSLK